MLICSVPVLLCLCLSGFSPQTAAGSAPAKKDGHSFLLLSCGNHLYPAHHPHHSTSLRARRQNPVHINPRVRRNHNLYHLDHIFLFLFVPCEATSVLRIKCQSSHETKGQLCLCLDRPFLLPLPPPVSPSLHTGWSRPWEPCNNSLFRHSSLIVN